MRAACRSAIALLALAPLFAGAVASGPALRDRAGMARGVIVDRVIATVGWQVITLSECRKVWGIDLLLKHQPPRPLPDAQVHDVASDLVNQALIAQEIEASRFPTVPAAEVEQQRAKMEASYGGAAGFQKALRSYGLAEKDVRDYLDRQVNVERFLELRFRPVVQVSEPAIEKYYSDVFLPKLKAQGAQQLPGLDDVRDQVEEILIQERISEEYLKWIRDLRAQTNVQFR